MSALLLYRGTTVIQKFIICDNIEDNILIPSVVFQCDKQMLIFKFLSKSLEFSQWTFSAIQQPFKFFFSNTCTYYGMCRGTVIMYLPPEHPIIAIWNNRIQNGCHITEKVHCTEYQLFLYVMLFCMSVDDIIKSSSLETY